MLTEMTETNRQSSEQNNSPNLINLNIDAGEGLKNLKRARLKEMIVGRILI